MSITRQDIIKMKETGLTQKAIGLRMGISAERVRQIIHGRSVQKEHSLKIDIPLSTGDVAHLLNVHTNTVRRWTRNGILKAYRIGPRGDRRFLRKDVKRLFQRST